MSTNSISAFRLSVILVVGVVTGGCEGFSSGADIVVELPSLPSFLGDRFVPTGILLSFLSSDTTLSFRILPPETRTVSIRVAREHLVPITAEMIIPGESFQRLKCGAFFPVDEHSGHVGLTWEDGCLADFFLRYLSTTENSPWFNIGTIRAVAHDATGGDPWNLDLDVLAAGVSVFVLSHSVVREAKMKEALNALPPGSWYRIDPLFPTPVVIDRTQLSVMVSTGFHSFVEAKSGARAEVYAGKENWISVVNRDPESVVSGRW